MTLLFPKTLISYYHQIGHRCILVDVNIQAIVNAKEERKWKPWKREAMLIYLKTG